MVERIMLLKLHHEDARARVARHVRDLLVGMEGVEEVLVGLPADAAAAKSWDVSVVISFATEAATSVTLESEAYKAFTKELADEVQVVKAWNFERLV